MCNDNWVFLRELRPTWCKPCCSAMLPLGCLGCSCYLPRRRRPGTGDIAMPPVRLSVCPSVCLSVCLSVTFSFCTVTQKRIDVFSRNFAGKTILSDFTFYAIFNIKKNKYWKVPLHLLVKWEVVSPSSREGQLESISIISSMPLFWFCISNGARGGGGV